MNDSSPLSPPTRADSGLETVIPKAVAVTTAGGLDTIIPKPVAVTTAGGTFSITASTQIHVAPETDAVSAIGNYLAERLRPATGYALPVLASNATPAGQIALTIAGSDPALGDEGYVLTIAPDGVTIIAARPAGLFYGVQTLRQLLPPSIEHSTAQPGPWKLPAGTIRDNPRFEWRGAMLDVARHFFGVTEPCGLPTRTESLWIFLPLSSQQGLATTLRSCTTISRLNSVRRLTSASMRRQPLNKRRLC